MNKNLALLNLFNAVQVDNYDNRKVVNMRFEDTIPQGYILSPKVASIANAKLLETISSVVGLSGAKANAAFHKNWKIVQDTPQEILVVQQIIHYITTYVFEALGIYDKDSVYIPIEALDVPALGGLHLIVVQGLDKDEVLYKIVDLASSGIALKTETLDAIMAIVEDNKYDSEWVGTVKNKELLARLYEFYNIVPQNPVAYLRFLINKITGDSLLIKNRDLITKIKSANSPLHVKTLDRLLEQAPDDLASIFLRYKPLFLALKSISKNKKFFNRLRKDAVELHKPLPEDYLNTVTSKIKNNKFLLRGELQNELRSANIWRNIRLAYALVNRLSHPESIVYRVRNGKGYTTDSGFGELEIPVLYETLNTVLDSIYKKLQVKDKVIYIPDYITYTLPSTEKMFSGNFPTGTFVEIPEDMIVGIHWNNVGSHRVDLDLSTMSVNGKVGWDSDYRNAQGDTLFSGDITDAPKGASELFYIKQGSSDDKLMYLNYFNYDKSNPVPTKIFVAHETPKNFGKDYVVDPNNILAQANVSIDRQQAILGLITKSSEGKQRFYFAHITMGSSIISSYSPYSAMTREFLTSTLKNTLDFRIVLELAGAKIVNEKPEEGEFIDLSPEALDKTTIINLINQK